MHTFVLNKNKLISIVFLSLLYEFILEDKNHITDIPTCQMSHVTITSRKSQYNTLMQQQSMLKDFPNTTWFCISVLLATPPPRQPSGKVLASSAGGSGFNPQSRTASYQIRYKMVPVVQHSTLKREILALSPELR